MLSVSEVVCTGSVHCKCGDAVSYFRINYEHGSARITVQRLACNESAKDRWSRNLPGSGLTMRVFDMCGGELCCFLMVYEQSNTEVAVRSSRTGRSAAC